MKPKALEIAMQVKGRAVERLLPGLQENKTPGLEKSTLHECTERDKWKAQGTAGLATPLDPATHLLLY